MNDNRMFLVTADRPTSQVLERELHCAERRVMSADARTVLNRGAIPDGDEFVDVLILSANPSDPMTDVDVCRSLRSMTDAYIMLITGPRPEAERIAALEAGIDDAVTLPISTAELAARVKAHLRRMQHGMGNCAVVNAGGLSLDLANHRLRMDGECVPVTHKEFLLLQLLMRTSGQLVDRDTIFREVWGPDWYGDENVLAVYIRRLRQKLGEGLGHPLIENVRGVGYRLVIAA